MLIVRKGIVRECSALDYERKFKALGFKEVKQETKEPKKFEKKK